MNHLRYSSDEMFSSTELIRKSKMIFDKLNKKEVEKAIILRDGKPGFMLLDFATYEEIMREYIELKSKKPEDTNEQYMSLDEIEVIDNTKKPETSMEKVQEQIKVVEGIVEEANKQAKETITAQPDETEPETKEKVTKLEEIQSSEINDEELQKALEEIEKMNLSAEPNETSENTETVKESDFDEDFEMNLEDVSKEETEKQPLKEFWD